jgi:hypothetical protein
MWCVLRSGKWWVWLWTDPPFGIAHTVTDQPRDLQPEFDVRVDFICASGPAVAHAQANVRQSSHTNCNDRTLILSGAAAMLTVDLIVHRVSVPVRHDAERHTAPIRTQSKVGKARGDALPITMYQPIGSLMTQPAAERQVDSTASPPGSTKVGPSKPAPLSQMSCGQSRPGQRSRTASVLTARRGVG